MKLVIIFGAGAVGKMTVGQELAKITDLRLFYNHMDIELVLEIFGGFHKQAISRIRQIIFEEFAKTDLGGMIFTYMWAFDQQSDWNHIERFSNIFKQEGGETYYVELVADQKVRLERHATPNRLAHKASKRDLEVSTARLLHEDENYRLTSLDGEIPFENYIKIDNTNMPPEVVATKIKTHFKL